MKFELRSKRNVILPLEADCIKMKSFQNDVLRCIFIHVEVCGEVVMIFVLAWLYLIPNIMIRLLFSKTRPDYYFRDYIYNKKKIAYYI